MDGFTGYMLYVVLLEFQGSFNLSFIVQVYQMRFKGQSELILVKYLLFFKY